MDDFLGIKNNRTVGYDKIDEELNQHPFSSP